jgi:N-acetylmuramoyl-L-alanine amidase
MAGSVIRAAERQAINRRIGWLAVSGERHHNPPMRSRAMLLALAAFALPATAAPRVAVDVGHTVADPGAWSARGRSEYDFNREFAGRLADALAARSMVVLPVNFSGDIGSLAERPARAAASDFFVSVHHDSIGEEYLATWDWDGLETTHTDLKRGFGLFVSRRNPDLPRSLRCATEMGAALRRAGFEPTPWHARKHLPADADNGVWYYDNLVVLHKATFPAVLFEAGVIKHREEELELRDAARQGRMADAVAAGIAACRAVRGRPARE